MGQSSTQSFILKMLVAKEENKVILAESSKEFIEVLFSFMVMPIGSTIRRTRNCLPGDIGCLNNLYASVENLDTNFLQRERYRDVLLNPRSAAEIYCKNLQLNLTESNRNELYICFNCKLISNVHKDHNVMCRCGENAKHNITNQHKSSFFGEEGVFLKSTARFMITDDFKVMPVSTVTGLTLLNELENYGKIEERTIKIGRDEVLELLKCSLRSRTPLSEIFLGPSIDKSGYGIKYGPGGMNPSQKVKDFWKKSINIRFKLIFDKVDNIALYAIVEEDFVNTLCTFLTLPLGYVFHQFPSLSFAGCIGNLHKSIQETQVNLFCHQEMKEILVNPKLPPGLAYNGDLFGIKEATIPFECSTFSSHFSAKSRILSTKPNQGKQEVFEGFIKGPSMFMVTDNLEIKPLSPISVKSLVDKLQAPLSDIGEQEMILDEDKALRLFAASWASKNALTITFLPKETNFDCLDFLRLMWGGKSYKMA